MQALSEMHLFCFIIKSGNVGTTPLEEIAMLNYHTKFSTKIKKFYIYFFSQIWFGDCNSCLFEVNDCHTKTLFLYIRNL